jgi:hypothetical protein
VRQTWFQFSERSGLHFHTAWVVRGATAIGERYRRYDEAERFAREELEDGHGRAISYGRGAVVDCDGAWCGDRG